SSFVIILLAVGLVVSTIVLVVPLAFQQFEEIFLAMNGMVTTFTQWLISAPIASFLNRYGISTPQLQSFVKDNLTKNIEGVIKGLLQGTLGLFSGLSTIVSSIVNIVIIPFITFYFLKDFPLVKHRAMVIFPKQKRTRVRQYYQYVDEVLGRYIRGTATIALVDAVCITLFFWFIGIPYPLVLGIISGVLSFIPYFGFLTMLFLSAIVASLSPSQVLLHVVLGLSTVAVMHIIEMYILSPRIIGGKIGLHPVLLILSLLAFSFFLGFIGLLIAIPASAIIIVFIKEWERTRNKESQIAPILEDRIGEDETA
ncbi:MAG: AI-2E family transporter, partial [Ignavibacteriales bacterium]|nr:AI-2E family transporter [Ignavibacteriales bacterium]